MKKRFFYLLLLPMMAFTMSNCNPDDNGGNGGNNNGSTASVTPTELVFESESATKSVTVTYGSDYNYYGATVDGDGQGWCTVTTPGNGTVDITVTKNAGAQRTCFVKCWVSASENPTEDEKTILPVSVTQDAYKIEVTEPTFVRFNFETEAHRHHTDYGGGFDVYKMLYLWHREWNEMTVECSQSGDRLTFWAHDNVEGAPNGNLLYDHVWEVEILVTGFEEPYNRCEVSQVTYRHHKIGRNPDPNGYWQSSETDEVVTLTNIPIKDHNINVNGKTGHLYFEYTDEDMQVSQCKATSRSEALNNDECYTEDYEYIGSDRDIGLVELKFNLK